MAKRTIIYHCTRCGAQYPGWQGRCSTCQAWGTVVEETVHVRTPSKADRTHAARSVTDLAAVQGQDRPHRPTGVQEFDRVLSGGLVDGSLTLLGGNPGVGKSTLVLQVAAGIAAQHPVLYVSGEESKEQLKLRYDRLKLATRNVQVMTETDIPTIVAIIEELQPRLAVVDSVQTMTIADLPGEPGGPTQIKASTVQLLEAAKRSGTSIILIGHVTKEGVVAGPKTLEHLVDTVLYLEGDDTQTFRLLRSVKNRFGVTDEVGVFTMTERGLETVRNPSQLFLMEERIAAPGNAVTAVVEGTRPFLIEVQALVTQTPFGYPRRLARGMDSTRLELLLAVLTKRAGLPLGSQDVYVNVVGGLRVKETALDLAAALAVASGFLNIVLPEKTVMIGEIGLGGEVRPVARTTQRLAEAAKLGFENALLPAAPQKAGSMRVQIVRTVQEAVQYVRQSAKRSASPVAPSVSAGKNPSRPRRLP